MTTSSRSIRVGVKDASRREQGFTILELAVVMMIIGLMATTASIMYISGSRNADYRAATEMIQQDLRKLYNLANTCNETNGVRDAYQIEFHGTGGNPPNAYRMLKGTWNGSGYNWATMNPEKGTYNKLQRVGSVDWIKPGGTDVRLECDTGVTFISTGSIIKAVANDLTEPDSLTVTVTSGSLNASKTITVYRLGSITCN